MELDKLKKQKDGYINKIFYLGLKIALIFGVPAVAGALIGKRIDARYDSGNKFSVMILVGTFILSWIITIFMYNNLAKKIKKVEGEIKIEKEKIENTESVAGKEDIKELDK
jgi:membrane-anchored glycerophosphoryl diester phosphodiesterase (GDPDase)